ncbi:MAG: PAS domain-containing protein [Phycisphaerae bacterium]|nr:PAS domain-containing protein [Phycisphaerae bacterium]
MARVLCPVALAAASGYVLALGSSAGPGWRWWTGWAGLTGAAGWAVGAAAARGAAVRRVVRTTQDLLASSPAGSDRRTDEVRGASGADGLDELRGAIDRVGDRFAAQVKEAAKRGRNLESLIEALPEPVIATDSRDRVLFNNGAAERMLGRGVGELTGRPIAELFTRREILTLHADARVGRGGDARARLTTPRGSRVYQVTASPVPAAWGEGVFGAVLVLRDVTELAEAVQVKSDFAANASHELRTPVATIRGAAETLLDGAMDDPPMRDRLVRMVASNAARLENLIRDLMDLSRLEASDRASDGATIDFSELGAGLTELLGSSWAERKLRVRFEWDPSAAGLVCDARLLSLVLRNLLENAIRFAHEGTEIVVRAARFEASGGGSVGVRFEVTDRGQGIPLHQQHRVFERFFQGDSSRAGPGGSAGTTPRGTGLGLAIVKHAVTAMGGTVSLESVLGEGTTVRFEIPVEPGPGGRAA